MMTDRSEEDDLDYWDIDHIREVSQGGIQAAESES